MNSMKISVNDMYHEVNEGISISELLKDLGYSSQGIAVASNGVVIARSLWEKQILKEGESLIIIQAVSGG